MVFKEDGTKFSISKGEKLSLCGTQDRLPTLQACRTTGNAAPFLHGVPWSKMYMCPLKFSVLVLPCWSHALVSEERLRAEPVPYKTDEASSCPMTPAFGWLF